MKKFHQLKTALSLVILAVVLCIIVGIHWLFIGYCGWTLGLTVICGLYSLLFIPLLLWQYYKHFYVIVDNSSISCEVIDDKTDNGGWVEDLENVKSVKITTKEECQKYYKNCNSKKVILIDFGNGNVKYIALKWFTAKQAQKIVKAITENVASLKAAKQTN